MLAAVLRCSTVIASALLLPAPAHAAATAKAAIREVTAAAQKWQGDAVLTHVATLMGRGDGRADQWLYTFYSPKANRSAIVTAKDQAVTDVTADVRNTSVSPVGGDYLDSDRVVEAAVKAGVKIARGARGIGFGLVTGNQAVGKAQLIWTVTLLEDDRMSSVVVNGKDGALIRRDEQKFK